MGIIVRNTHNLYCKYACVFLPHLIGEPNKANPESQKPTASATNGGSDTAVSQANEALFLSIADEALASNDEHNNQNQQQASLHGP